MEFMQGYRTYAGLVVAFLGVIGVSEFFGGTEGMTNFLNLLLQLVGLGIAAWGRFAATRDLKK